MHENVRDAVDNFNGNNGAENIDKKPPSNNTDDVNLAKTKKAKELWDMFTYEELLKTPPPKQPCFLAGTLVKTENGLKPIELIQKGDLVYAYNFEKQIAELKPVTELFTNVCDKYIIIYTKNDPIQTTGAHRFWIPEKNKWVKVRELTTEMSFMNANGEKIKIDKLEIIDQSQKTYNFEVEDLHNYFVGTDEILTHNKSIKDSIFASKEILEVEFYRIIEEVGDNLNSIYVGQTIQGIGKRYDQHKIDIKKADWLKKMNGVLEIKINNKSGPFKMTPYEAAVTELYEINSRGGLRKGNKGLYNKSKPISKRKFEYFKKHGNFNPCLFYV